MKDNKDKIERLKYLNEERKKQEEKMSFYENRLNDLRKLLDFNQKEIIYNRSWISFHKESAKEHQKTIINSVSQKEKVDQKNKLQFHLEQIQQHHKEYIQFHKKEIFFIKKEIKLYEKGIALCMEQFVFLNKRVEENTN